MSFILSGEYRGKVIAPNDGNACFGSWFHSNPITLSYHVHGHKVNDDLRKWWSFLFNDLGLREFFTPEQVDTALATGVMTISAEGKDRNFILAVTTAFRYHEEFPDTPVDVLTLQLAGATPIEAFIAAHFIEGGVRAQSWGHHSCFLARGMAVSDEIYTYMERLRSGTVAGCHSTWGGKVYKAVPNAIDAALRSNPRTLATGVAYFQSRQTFTQVKQPVVRKKRVVKAKVAVA